MARLKIFGEARYCSIDETRIVEMLLVHGWRFDVAAGRRERAEGEARAALERFIALGLSYCESASGRKFDPVETWNYVKWAHFHRAERIWEDHCVRAARRQVWETVGDNENWDRPPMPDVLAPRRFAVTIRRAFNLSRYRSGERVRLRLPLPLEDSSLRDLSVEFLPPSGVEVKTVMSPARLDVIIPVPAEGQACIGVRASFTAYPTTPQGALSLDPMEVDLYTRPSEGLIKVNERIGDLAAQLAGREVSSLNIVRRFWTFMLDELALGAIHYDALDPASPLDWVLDHGWYDCKIGSALMAALCRSRRIPARLVTGYMLHVTAPCFHTWLEVWIDGHGWLPFDLMCWDLSAGGRDEGWRNYYFDHIDHRMVVERPPHLFSGLGTVRLPATWHMLISQTDRGSAVVFEDVDTGTVAYRENIDVERL
jgi:hypothetical protein